MYRSPALRGVMATPLGTTGSKVRFARHARQNSEIWKVSCPRCSVSDLAMMRKPSKRVGKFRVDDDADTVREATKSGRGIRTAQHGARVTITADRHDRSIRHVNMLGERNEAEDCVNIYDGDAVLAIDNKADYVDALHD